MYQNSISRIARYGSLALLFVTAGCAVQKTAQNPQENSAEVEVPAEAQRQYGEALAELETAAYKDDLAEDKTIVLQRLRISEDYFSTLMQLPGTRSLQTMFVSSNLSILLAKSQLVRD